MLSKKQMAFKDTDAPPGAYPVVTHRRRIKNETKKVATNITRVSTSKSLGLKSSTMDKVKSYFQYSKKVQVVESKKSRWRNFWFRRKEQQQVVQQSNTSNTVAVGTVFSLSVPITISSHYYSKEETSKTTSRTTSIVQQLVILPPLQVYGFLFLAILFLLVIAFALGYKLFLFNKSNKKLVLKIWRGENCKRVAE